MMNYSRSDRLNWEYGIRRRFNLTSIIVFFLSGIFLVLLATFVWMAVTGDSFIKSLYWTIQTMTTVGYGTSFSDWGGVEQVLCIAWMLISVGYWGCLLTVFATHIAYLFRR